MEKLEFRPDVLGFAAQDPDAGGVEGGDPHGLGPAADEGLDPLAHFRGGFVGERDGQDLAVMGPVRGDQVGDPVAEHPRFARSGAGHDQQGAPGMLDGFLLLRVQPLQEFGGRGELRAVPSPGVGPEGAWFFGGGGLGGSLEGSVGVGVKQHIHGVTKSRRCHRRRLPPLGTCPPLAAATGHTATMPIPRLEE